MLSSESRPAADPVWCERWDEVSAWLESELTGEACDVERVAHLFKERQRLMTAAPMSPLGADERTDEAQRLWLEASLAREARIVDAMAAMRGRIELALRTLRGNGKVRDKFEASEPSAPRRVDGHI